MLVVGLNENLEGEEMHESNAGGSGDKADLLLPAPQRKLMEVIAGTGKPVVLVNMTGSAMDLRFAGCALLRRRAGLVPGRAGRQGDRGSRLAGSRLSFYNSADDLPAFTDYAMENRTYRYFKGDVLYPFGFSLSVRLRRSRAQRRCGRRRRRGLHPRQRIEVRRAQPQPLRLQAGFVLRG